MLKVTIPCGILTIGDQSFLALDQCKWQRGLVDGAEQSVDIVSITGATVEGANFSAEGELTPEGMAWLDELDQPGCQT